MTDLFLSWLWWWLCRCIHMVKHQQTCAACVCAQLLQSCLTLCHPMDWSPPGFSVCGILHTRVLQWDAMSSSWGSSQPRGWTWVSYITGRFFTVEPLGRLCHIVTQHKNGGPLDTYTLASLHYLSVFRITEFNYIYIDKIKFLSWKKSI